MPTTLYLIEQGAELGCDGERLVVRRDDDVLGSSPISAVGDVVIFGNILTVR